MGSSTSSGQNQSSSNPQFAPEMRPLVSNTTALLQFLQNQVANGLGSNGGPDLLSAMFMPKTQNIPNLSDAQNLIGGAQMTRAFGDPMNATQHQAIDQINTMTSGPLGSSPATIAAMNAVRTPALNDLALAGLGNSDAVGSSTAAAYAPILAQEMATRAGVIPQLGQLGTNVYNQQSQNYGDAFNTQEAQRQITAQQGQSAYSDFLRQIQAASGITTGILGQFPMGATTQATGSQSSLKAGLK